MSSIDQSLAETLNQFRVERRISQLELMRAAADWLVHALWAQTQIEGRTDLAEEGLAPPHLPTDPEERSRAWAELAGRVSDAVKRQQ